MGAPLPLYFPTAISPDPAKAWRKAASRWFARPCTLDPALRYHREGLVAIPLRAGYKAPAISGWQTEGEQTEARVRELFTAHDGNIGIVCGAASRLVAVDVDTKAGKVGAQSLAAFEAKHGKLPKTRTHGSPSGGFHYLYRTPADLRFRTSHVMGRDIDVMGGGGQIVAPPSVLVGTVDPKGRAQIPGAYAVLDDAPIADCPPSLLALLKSAEAVVVDSSALAWTPVSKEDPTYAERAAVQREDFATAALYLEGEGKGNVRYVMLFQRLGPGLLLDYETTVQSYAEHYDPRLPDGHRWLPQDAAELAHTAARAYERPMQTGYQPDQMWREHCTLREMRASSRETPTPPPDESAVQLSAAPKRKRLSPAERARRVGGLGIRLKTGLPSIDAATRGGLLLRKVAVFGGAPGSGKTATVVQLAHRWLDGGVHVGLFAADEDADALLIRFGQLAGLSRDLLENGDPAERARLAEWCERVPLILADADEDETLEQVSRDLRDAAAGEPSALIVDSVQTARTAESPPNGSDIRARINVVVRALKHAAKVDGHLVVATSEISKAAYRNRAQAENINPLSAFKESGDIEYGVSLAVVLVSRQGSSELVDAVVAKNRLGQGRPDILLKLDHTRAGVTETSTAEATTADPLYFVKSEIRDALAARGSPMSRTTIYTKVGGKKSKVVLAINEMLEANELFEERRGIRFPLPGERGYVAA